jgi:hypothetical protein
MVKNITTVAFNSMEVERTIDNSNNNILFRLETPPILIQNKGILKVSNFCHIGTDAGHTDNMYLFRIKNVMVDTSRFLSGTTGYPLILTTTFNNNRSLYDENVIKLVKQTINSIEIVVDTYKPDAKFEENLYLANTGGGYLRGQLLRLNVASTNYNVIVGSVDNEGGITSFYFPDTKPPNDTYTSLSDATFPSIFLSTQINGTGASLTATVGSGAITSITINSAGLGYRVGQALSFSGGGGSGADITIRSVTSSGAIESFLITSGGTLYATAPTVTVAVGSQTQSARFAISFGRVLTEQIPISLNFSITFIIEQDEF